VRHRDKDGRTIDRWIRRGTSCVLCPRWPAPYDHRVDGRLQLLCQRCENKPDSLAHLVELTAVDWQPAPEPGSLWNACHLPMGRKTAREHAEGHDPCVHRL
jgi:hypothetical protein